MFRAGILYAKHILILISRIYLNKYMKQKLLSYSFFFQEMFLSKDIFLIPYYISKELNLPFECRYCENLGETPISEEYRGVKIKSINSHFGEFISMLCAIVLKVWGISVLFLHGSSAKHMLIVRIYKFLNPKGKVVIFGDMEAPQARELSENGFLYSKGIKGRIKSYLTDFFFNHVTYLVANTEAYLIMKDLCDRKGWRGLLHFYPCLDDELVKEYGIQRKNFDEKENIIICVGRIGNFQKNTEMLLDALKSVDLKDWKVYMIGPITSSFDLKEESNFQNEIDKFYLDYSQYKENLIFTGMIYDQKEMFDYYNRAKVLLSTARHEGFANVYSQAAAFGCYIISTDVGGADVGSNNWTYGTKIEQEDSKGLSKVLNDLVKGDISIAPSKSLLMEEMSYSKRVKDVLIPNLK